MAVFVEFTTPNNKPHYIKTDSIDTFRAVFTGEISNAAESVLMVGGSLVYIREDLVEVKKKLGLY